MINNVAALCLMKKSVYYDKITCLFLQCTESKSVILKITLIESLSLSLCVCVCVWFTVGIRTKYPYKRAISKILFNVGKFVGYKPLIKSN